MKKALLLLVAGLLPLGVFAHADVTIDDIHYYLDEGEALVMDQSTSLSGDVVIPDTVRYDGDYYIVVEVDGSAFKGCTKITSVTLPNTVTTIGASCFSGCTSLTTVTLPEGITSLPAYCFNNCKKLYYVELPESLTSLGDYCFYYCSTLNAINLPDGVTSLGTYCFYECSSLTSVVLPDGITSLGDYTFEYCSKLTSVTLPEGITSLGSYCFYQCTSLTTIALPSSLTSLGSECFRGCTSLTSIDIPDGVTSLGEECFEGCTKLASVTLSNSLTSLGYECFYNCGSLEEIILPRSITSIGRQCFQKCSSLMSVYCEWESLDNVDVSTNSTFDGIYSKAKLYVPTGTIDMYSAQSWTSYFNAIEEYTPEDMTVVPDACASPTIGYANGHLTFSSETEGASYHYSISCDDVCTNSYSQDGDVILAAAYYIKAYASAEGYANSATVYATLFFVEGSVGPTTDDEDETSISATEVRGVVVTTNGGTVTISGLEDGESVEAYSLGGIKLGAATAKYGSATVNVGGASGVTIIRLGDQAIKVKL